jgi:hypothetical protein
MGELGYVEPRTYEEVGRPSTRAEDIRLRRKTVPIHSKTRYSLRRVSVHIAVRTGLADKNDEKRTSFRMKLTSRMR